MMAASSTVNFNMGCLITVSFPYIPQATEVGLYIKYVSSEKFQFQKVNEWIEIF